MASGVSKTSRVGERWAKGLESMDPLDVELEDADLLDEVELTAALIVAANEVDAPLSVEEIDRVLGVTPVSAA